MHSALFHGFQPVPMFPRPQWQLIRFIRKKMLKPTESEAFDWFVDNLALDNKIYCKADTTIVQLLATELAMKDHCNVRKIIRKLVSLDIVRKESTQLYVFNPYIVNRLAMIPMHAFGFSDNKIKVLESKGYRVWKITDDREKKNLPSSRLRLQAAKFRAMKISETTDIPATHAEDEIMIANLQRQLSDVEERAEQERIRAEERHQELIDMFKAFTDKHCSTPEAKEDAKCHLTLLQGGVNESTN